MSQGEPVGKTTGLAEKGALAETCGRKGRRLKRSRGVSLGHEERKLERQQPS